MGKAQRTQSRTRAAAAALLLAEGKTVPEVARLLKIGPRQAYRLANDARPAIAAAQRESIAARCDQLVDAAFPAIVAGLNDSTDSYKRAGVGVQVLKGRGVFAPDTQTQTYQQLVLAAPAGMRAALGIETAGGAK